MGIFYFEKFVMSAYIVFVIGVPTCYIYLYIINRTISKSK